MAVYYQTYRPQNFSEVVGQEPIVKALISASKLGKIGHAYLFCGSRGVGKTTLARILAKAANCPNLKDGDPCGTCEVCTAIARGTFLDVIEIDAASHTGVDNIRELIERINFGPTQGKTKVFIIDEVHMLSKAAFNALLKTLEEPPAHALFILATTDIDKVPDTIVSRTQRFDFRKITAPQILETLKRIVKKEKLKIDETALQIIVDNSEGGLRDALSQLSMIAVLDKTATEDDIHLLLGTTSRATVIALLGLVASGTTSAMPEFFAKQTEANFDPNSFTRKVLQVLQELLEDSLAKTGGDHELAGKFLLPQLLHVMRLYLRAYKEIERALSPELPLLLASIEAALYMSGGRGIPQQGNQPAKPAAAEPTSAPVNPIQIQQPAETVVAEAAATIAISGDLPVLQTEQVSGWWPSLIDELRKVNGPLATLLRNCPIASVEGNKVVVAVKYLFHKEQLESTKIRSFINEHLSNQAGGPVIFSAVIDKRLTVSEQINDTATAVSDALRIFGGEVIE